MRVFLITLIFLAVIGYLYVNSPSAEEKTSDNTKDFVETASIANKFEVLSSQLALERSKNEDVRKFAQQMIDDHTPTGDKLKSIVGAKGKPDLAKENLDSKHQQLFDELKASSDEDFDKLYVKDQEMAHDKALSLFEDYSEDGEDNELKAFAKETLPTLEQHKEHVTKLNSSL